MLASSVALGATALMGCHRTTSARADNARAAGLRPGFVGRDGMQLVLDDAAYRFVGANLWYAAYLGADAEYGDRARLGRELDRLSALGVTNLRLLASAEEGPLETSIKPGFRTKTALNESLLQGLDYCLAELAKRDMKAVLYLTNYWDWSGGMRTYLWYTDPTNPAQAPADASAFYGSQAALTLYHDYVRQLVTRVNTVTGAAYKDDPAIMAWQHCNEPRPGGSAEQIAQNLPAYYAWISSTARLIRGLDPHHLISLGHEGTIATNGDEAIVAKAHAEIDYVTAHIWPLNWGWVKGKDLAGTWSDGANKVASYLQTHERIARSLNKPLIVEEFGFPRDGELYDPSAATSFRQHYYALVYGAVEANAARGGPICGSNFWAWTGEGRASHPDFRFKAGDRSYTGDPPHEPQGWYGNLDSDAGIQELIRAHAQQLARLEAESA